MRESRVEPNRAIIWPEATSLEMGNVATGTMRTLGLTAYRCRAWLAQAVLLLYLFFVMFGTSAPFSATSHDIADKSLANPVSQFIYSLLFMLSLLCLLPQLRQVFRVLRREKFLTAFLAWSFLSVLWSDAIGVSFKRVIQLAMTVTISFTALLYSDASKSTLKLLLTVLVLYLSLSLVALLTVPAAIDSRNGAWQGMGVSKNHFGQAMVISCLAWSIGLSYRLVRHRLMAMGMLALSLVMLAGSSSATSAIALLFLGIIAAIWWLSAIGMAPAVARGFAIVTITTIGLLTLFTMIHVPQIMDAFLGGFGRDSTLTGRIELWGVVWEYASEHLFKGCGFGGFWTVLNDDLLVLYDEFIWLPNQSHMGYLDIINELGLVGLGLFLVMLVAYGVRLLACPLPQIWAWFVIAALILNTQETTLFRTHILSGVVFIHAYLAVTMDTLKFRGEI